MIYHQWKNGAGVGAIVDRFADLPADWDSGLGDHQGIWVGIPAGAADAIVVAEILRLVEENAGVNGVLDAIRAALGAKGTPEDILRDVRFLLTLEVHQDVPPSRSTP